MLAFLFVLLTVLLCQISYLLWRQYKSNKQHNNKEQVSKVLLALLSYPVHQYPMVHMLERSLGILFAVPNLSLAKQGAVYLLENNKLTLSGHRGLNKDQLAHYSQLPEVQCLCATKLFNQGFSYSQCNQTTCNILSCPGQGYGHYTLPLIKQNQVLGVLLLCTKNVDQHSRTFQPETLKSVANCIASLVERKHIADDSTLGERIFKHSQQSIIVTDAQQNIIKVNRMCEQVSGYSADELLGKTPKILQSGQQSREFYQQLWRVVNKHNFWQGEVWNKRKDGSVYPGSLNISSIKDSEDITTHYLAIFSDLSSIKEAEQNINQLAFFDSLTKLPNRELLNDRLSQAIAQATRQENQIVLLCLGIDHFKNINDSLGRQYGDILLKEIAQRLKKILRSEDTIARVGSDEFAILIRDIDDTNKIYHLAKKILSIISEPFELKKHQIYMTCSIGIATFPRDGQLTYDLIKYADSAMHQAKRLGRNTFQFYTKELNKTALRRLKIESELRLAIENEGLDIFLQPQINLQAGGLSGAEALLRWQHSDMGYISPAEFIPIAEDSGLIIPLGEWLFTAVCLQVKSWSDQQLFPEQFKRIAINISPNQFNSSEFISRLQSSITKTQVDVRCIEIELTESTLQEESESVLRKLKAIKKMGIHIAIDDFGTGYSSLSRLKNFPVDLIKIDRSFVLDISHDDSDIAIVQAIIAMASALNIKTLAEGVETLEQLQALQRLSCHYYQGFYCSKAISFSDFKQFLLIS